MTVDNLTDLIKFLQACITPVAMISGVGLLLLTVTNRMARTIDRTRQLIAELDKKDCMRADEKKGEILIFIRRSELLRNSIAWIMTGMITSCLIIPILFVMSFTSLDLRMFGYAFFLSAVTSMLIAFVYFFRDILQSLKAIKLEAKHITA
jgi:hypothetical protein